MSAGAGNYAVAVNNDFVNGNQHADISITFGGSSWFVGELSDRVSDEHSY
jgi:sulfur carrier protein ThiS